MSTSGDSDQGDLNVKSVKSDIVALLIELDDAERDSVEQWISSTDYRKDLLKLKSFRNEQNKLNKIAAVIRKQMPLEAELPTEQIVVPKAGDLADCLQKSTCHVDEFLYDDLEVDKMVAKGKISRHYCISCGSRDIKELTFISHSLSCRNLLYVFKVVLSKDLSGLQVLDIGSRLGAVLYGAYHFSNAASIVGVEMNKELCELQNNVIAKFHLDSNRIKVINADIMTEKNSIENSNVIIINVFDFFVDTDKQIEMWNFFKSSMKKGTRLVTIRSVAETLTSLGVYEDFEDWLSYTELEQIENQVLFNMSDNDLSEIYFYTVK